MNQFEASYPSVATLKSVGWSRLIFNQSAQKLTAKHLPDNQAYRGLLQLLRVGNQIMLPIELKPYCQKVFFQPLGTYSATSIFRSTSSETSSPPTT